MSPALHIPSMPTRYSFVAVASALLAAACVSPAPRTDAPDTPVPSTGSAVDTVTFLALGDSYTIGEAVPESDRWPVQLAALLRERGLAVQEPTIIARTGWTTDELAAQLDVVRLRVPFSLVSLLIGVNNQYRGRDAEQYRGEFRGLLERAIGFAGGEASRVIVVSIPDWGVTPFAEGRNRAQVASDIDRFNAINREVTRQLGARYVNITPGSRLAATDGSLTASDGLHPSGLMYAAWARATFPEALVALGRSPSN